MKRTDRKQYMKEPVYTGIFISATGYYRLMAL